jgi:putative glutamine transport system substrate-binding protein
MLEPIAKFLESASSLWKLREALIALSQTNPIVAGVIIFFLLIILVYLLVTNVANLALKVYSWLQSPTSAAGIIFGMIVAAVVSTGIVLSIRVSTAPVPAFTVEKDDFIRDPLYLTWTYDQQGMKNKDATVFYEIQSAVDNNFQIDVRREDNADVAYKYVSTANGPRYWRVRAVDGQTGQPISDWSRGDNRFTQYDSAYKRIEETGTVLIHVSSAENEDIFKWIDRTFKGFDIKLANAIVASLSDRMKKGSRPLKAKFVPTPFPELLNMPKLGKADIIISSISKLQERELKHELGFSETYFCTTQALVFPAGKPDQPVADMIRGKKVGFHAGTTSDRVAMALNKDVPFDVKPFSRVDQMIRALRRSELDIGITDAPFAAAHRRAPVPGGGQSRLGMKLFSSRDFPPSIRSEQFDEYAVAVHSTEDALLRAINDVIAQLKTSGSLSRMVEEATAEHEKAKRLEGMPDPPRARPWECPPH